jgi:hypothetical protein
VLRRELLAGSVALALVPGARAQDSAAPGGTTARVRRPIWGPPYTSEGLREAEQRFGIRFPPDLFAFLQKRRFARAPDWTKDEDAIRELLAWPLEGMLADVEQNGAWAPSWGPRPDSTEERIATVTRLVEAAPRLIPLTPYRYIPETPSRAGNPVFYVFLTDVRYFGENLEDFANRLSIRGPRPPVTGEKKHIPFWTEMSEFRFRPSARK